MRNYDNWLKEKEKVKNENKIILFLSGIFYKTFDEDARFLSDKY
jgi:DNA mismatch repair ATPase MutS